MRILIVHDTPLFREGLRSFLLSQADCSLVGEATQQEEVLSLARTHHPDIVLLDGELASADPLDLTWQLRQLGVPGILILASPTADEETFFQFLRHGATAYTDGTIGGTELMEKLHKMCLGEYLMDSEVLSNQAARRTAQARFWQVAQEALHREELKEASPLLESERLILEQIAQGQANAQIARQFGVSKEIIKNRLYRLMKKLHTKNRTAAVITAASRYWITLEAHEETDQGFPEELPRAQGAATTLIRKRDAAQASCIIKEHRKACKALS
jgi:two-component system, NarL family, response regulator LiaR